jgi:hypothetical protein
VYDVKRFDIILGKHWAHDMNGTYHINHRTNEMWITQGDIQWEVREKAVRIRYLHSLRPDSEPDDDTIKEETCTMSIEIIGKKHLCRMSHRLVARAFLIRVRYDNPELAQPPDEIQSMLRYFETCGLFTEPTYDTTQSKPQLKIDILPENNKKAPYRPLYQLSPKEDAELQRQLDKVRSNGLMRPSNSHYGSPVLFVSKKDGGLRM